jgi:DNA-binding transcriptional ArsR family regulator
MTPTETLQHLIRLEGLMSRPDGVSHSTACRNLGVTSDELSSLIVALKDAGAVITEKRSRGVRYQMKNRVFQPALTEAVDARKKCQSAEAFARRHDATERHPVSDQATAGHIWRHGQKPKWKGPKDE